MKQVGNDRPSIQNYELQTLVLPKAFFCGKYSQKSLSDIYVQN